MYKLNGRLLDMIMISDVQFREALETISKDPKLKLWSIKRKLGNIILTCALTYANDEEKIAKTEALNNMLKDGALQIDDKFYHVSVVNRVSASLDLSNFKLIFNWIGDINSGNYICPPSAESVTVNGLNVKVDFVKGVNAASTKLVCGATELTTEGNSFEFTVDKINTFYTLKLMSLDATLAASETLEVEFKSGPINIVPEKPSNVAIAVFGKNITLTFTKGTNAVSTEVEIDGQTTATFENTITVIAPNFSTQYEIKLRSKSETDSYSDYASINVTTDAIVTAEPPTDFVVSMDQKKVTISFTKGANANITEFLINGQTYGTAERFIVIEMPNYSTNYSFEARSKSIFDVYSAYTQAVNFATDRQIIISAAPIDVISSVDPVKKLEANISFVKDENAVSSEILINGSIIAFSGNSIVVNVADYGTTYTYKLRSKSSTNDYSPWTRDFTLKSGPTPIVPDAPSNINITVNNRLHATVTFTKANNAVSTELVCGAINLSAEGTTFEFDLDSYSTDYVIKLRSKSETVDFGIYVATAIKTPVEPIGAAIKNVLPNYNPYQINYDSSYIGMNYEIDLDLAYMGSNNIERYSSNYSVINGSLIEI